MKDLKKETEELIRLAKQAKAAEDDVVASYERKHPQYVLDNADYARVHRARISSEGACWRAMVALAREAGI
jgi:hypothetical protein